MKRAVRFGCVLCAGIVLGALGHYSLTCLGLNFRLLPHSLNGHTITEPDRGVHDNRVERIYAQFAHKVRLPSTSEEVHAVLKAAWLKQEMITGIFVLAGRIPVDLDGAFHIDLASKTDELTGQIYVAISGPETESEALDFLTGKGKANWRLKEFALCYPARPGEVMGRIEAFRWWGLQVTQN